MLIIGITGTIGAGKGAAVEYLKDRYSFLHFSARDLITEEILNRGMELNRDRMVIVANELRANNGPAYIIEKLFEKAGEAGQNSIIESIRTVGEIELLRNKGRFIMLAVDAPQEIRYERIKSRGSETDRITFEKFISDEEREMTSEDPNKQNLRACIELADHKIMNDSTLEELHANIDKIIENI
jgi:dephospho-CoA kinase